MPCIERSLAIRDRMVQAVREVYSTHRIMRSPSAVLHEAEIKVSRGVKAPHWVRAHVDGYAQRLKDELYERHLVYGGYVNGTFYSTHSDRDDYYDRHGVSPVEFSKKCSSGGHYWKEPLNGKMMPFFIGDSLKG